jgi:hypothetical protein
VKARRGLSVARPECAPRELGGIQPWSDARALATAERTPRRVEECRLRGEILGAWRGAAAGGGGGSVGQRQKAGVSPPYSIASVVWRCHGLEVIRFAAP